MCGSDAGCLAINYQSLRAATLGERQLQELLLARIDARCAACPAFREREIFIDNLLVRVHLIIEMSRPALRHGSLNSLFQVALYLPI